MRLSITNVSKRLQIHMLTTQDYRAETGIHPNTHHYSQASESTGYFWLQSYTGLMSGGATVSNTTLKAINTNGEYFAGNSWSPTAFTIKFKVLNNLMFQRLNECIKYKNEPLYVEIETDKTYFMWCILDSSSAVELGELTFISALDGQGIYWSAGERPITWYPGVGEYALVQSGPQSSLGSQSYNGKPGYKSYTIERFIIGEHKPVIELIKAPSDFTITQYSTGTTYTGISSYTNQDYKWDSENETLIVSDVWDESDRVSEFMQFSDGMEYMTLEVPEDWDMSETYMVFTYEDLYSTVFGG